MWRTVTSKDDSLTGILMHIVYKEEMYIAKWHINEGYEVKA